MPMKSSLSQNILVCAEVGMADGFCRSELEPHQSAMTSPPLPQAQPPVTARRSQRGFPRLGRRVGRELTLGEVG
jgi:hypothetical protein